VPKPRSVSGEPPTEPNFVRQTGGTEQVKTAAVYVRVSTAEQHVESQLYDLRELEARRGFESKLAA
jgi:hypothetical protein